MAGKRGIPLTDEERQAIIDLLPTGKSCRDIATEVGRSPDTISRIAKSVGHVFGHPNLARAHEVSKAYGAERRAERLVRLADRIERAIERMGEPHRVWSFGGMDNRYAEHELDEPTPEALDKLSSAVAKLTRAELDIVKHDERGEDDGADVDRWLDHITGAG